MKVAEAAALPPCHAAHATSVYRSGACQEAPEGAALAPRVEARVGKDELKDRPRARLEDGGGGRGGRRGRGGCVAVVPHLVLPAEDRGREEEGSTSLRAPVSETSPRPCAPCQCPCLPPHLSSNSSARPASHVRVSLATRSRAQGAPETGWAGVTSPRWNLSCAFVRPLHPMGDGRGEDIVAGDVRPCLLLACPPITRPFYSPVRQQVRAVADY